MISTKLLSIHIHLKPAPARPCSWRRCSCRRSAAGRARAEPGGHFLCPLLVYLSMLCFVLLIYLSDLSSSFVRYYLCISYVCVFSLFIILRLSRAWRTLAVEPEAAGPFLPLADAPWWRTHGVNANGEKGTPWRFWEDTNRLTGVPKWGHIYI